jgi:hypothetical protein
MIPFLPLILVGGIVYAIANSSKDEDNLNGVDKPLHDGQLTTIEKVKKGEFFKMPNQTTVYIQTGFNRFIKKYEGQKFEDINHFRSFKKGTVVEIDFTF